MINTLNTRVGPGVKTWQEHPGHMWVSLPVAKVAKNYLIFERSNGEHKKLARVHFIPDLKIGVFVTLRAPEVIKIGERPGGSLDFFLELLELLLGGFATRSCLLRELFCLGFLHFIKLLQLFLACWHKVTSLPLWLILLLLNLKIIPLSSCKAIKYTLAASLFLILGFWAPWSRDIPSSTDDISNAPTIR
jgi:hypothetical protein